MSIIQLKENALIIGAMISSFVTRYDEITIWFSSLSQPQNNNKRWLKNDKNSIKKLPPNPKRFDLLTEVG